MDASDGLFKGLCKCFGLGFRLRLDSNGCRCFFYRFNGFLHFFDRFSSFFGDRLNGCLRFICNDFSGFGDNLSGSFRFDGF